MSIPGRNVTAFPLNEKHDNGDHWCSHPGMSLRDYFAAAALQGVLANRTLTERIEGRAAIREVSEHELTATLALKYADAMLEERKK